MYNAPKVIKQIPQNIGWCGITFPKEQIKDYILKQKRSNKKTGEVYIIEYLTIEGRLKIFKEVCDQKNWAYEIKYNLSDIKPIITRPQPNQNQQNTIQQTQNQMYFVVLTCELNVYKDKIGGDKLYSVSTVNIGNVSADDFTFKKLQTNALGRCLNALGVGLEAEAIDEVEDDSNDYNNTASNPQSSVQPQPQPQPISSKTMQLYKELISLSKQQPEIIDLVQQELEFYGVSKFTELNEEDAERVYNVIREYINNGVGGEF